MRSPCGPKTLSTSAGSPDSIRYAHIVRQWTDDLILFVPAGSLARAQREGLAARAIGIVEAGADRVLSEDDRLTGVALDDDRVVRRDALFVPPRLVPNDGVLAALGCDVTSDGWVVTDSSGRTSVPGVWAADNVADPRAQVITAAGQGSAAAIAINADLVDEDVRDAVDRTGQAPRRDQSWPGPPGPAAPDPAHASTW